MVAFPLASGQTSPKKGSLKKVSFFRHSDRLFSGKAVFFLVQSSNSGSFRAFTTSIGRPCLHRPPCPRPPRRDQTPGALATSELMVLVDPPSAMALVPSLRQIGTSQWPAMFHGWDVSEYRSFPSPSTGFFPIHTRGVPKSRRFRT